MRLSCPKPYSTARALIYIALIFGSLFAALLVWQWWSDPVRWLRSRATDIHDYNDYTFNLTGDCTRFIRVDCSEDIFHRFARREGLTHRLTEDEPRGVMSWPTCNQPWWTPPRSYRGTYYSFREGGQCYMLAYSEGHLYYTAILW